jgi:hypothetical protein
MPTYCGYTATSMTRQVALIAAPTDQQLPAAVVATTDCKGTACVPPPTAAGWWCSLMMVSRQQQDEVQLFGWLGCVSCCSSRLNLISICAQQQQSPAVTATMSCITNAQQLHICSMLCRLTLHWILRCPAFLAGEGVPHPGVCSAGGAVQGAAEAGAL